MRKYLKFRIFAPQNDNIMAISIKTIPVLLGETADRFVREADSNSENKCPELSEAMELAISNMLESSRNFKFQ